jgi:hypothetical protein
VVRVADASVAIRGDMSGFSSDLKRAERETGGFAARIRGLLTPKGLLGAGALFGLGSSIPTLTRQAIGFLGDAAEAYGELQQTVRTIDNVFGESAQVIRDWGKTAADTAGMSQQTFMSSAAIMGQTLLNMGFEQEEAAQKVTLLLQRAADMALAFGKRPQDALLAITAAMRGERDTIEKFGVAIKQVDVNAQIAALGLDTSTAAAKKNAEALAVVNLVLEQSAEHAGRFARSQDDIAVKMARANAKIEDFTTTQLGPAVASIQLGAINAAESIGGYFAQTGDDIDAFAVQFGEQRERIWQAAQGDIEKFKALQATVAGYLRGGMDFEMALDVSVNPEAAAAAGLIMTVGVGDAIAQGAAEHVNPAVTEMMRGAGDMISASAPVITDASEIIADIPVDQFESRLDAARDVGASTVIEYAAGLLTPQNELQTAIDAALKVVEDEMSITEEIAFLSGKKVVLEEARGIAVQEGKDAAVLAIDGALSLIEDRMILLANNAYDYGMNTVSSYASGIVNNLGVVADAGRQLARNAAGDFTIESEPPNHDSPLYGITKWGGNIVKTMAQGIYGELGTASSAAGALAGALVPSLAGGAMGYGGGVAASQTINYNLHVSGVPKQVRSPEEMVEELLALSAFSEGRLA